MVKEPLYRQVYQELLSRIRNGSYSSGSRLPTEDQLGKEFAVSKVTTRQAIEMLVAQGLVQRWPGRGTFVAEDLSGRVARSLTGFAVDIERERSQIGIETVAIRSLRPSRWIEAALQRDSGMIATHVRRIRTLAGKPIMYLDHFLPQPPLPEELEDSRDWLFFRAYLVKQHGIIPSRNEAQLRAINAHGEICELLQIDEGTAVLGFKKLFFDLSDRPCEFLQGMAITSQWSYRMISYHTGAEVTPPTWWDEIDYCTEESCLGSGPETGE
jgi:GntR family transcriptional regulator